MCLFIKYTYNGITLGEIGSKNIENKFYKFDINLLFIHKILKRNIPYINLYNKTY